MELALELFPLLFPSALTTMSKNDAPKCVTALFSFKGKNNDEVSVSISFAIHLRKFIVGIKRRYTFTVAMLQKGRHNNYNANGRRRLVGGDIARQDRMVSIELR